MKRSAVSRMQPQLLVWLIVAILIPSVAQTQSVPNQLSANNATGTLPYVTYGGVHENINLATGNMNLQLLLVSLPGRNKLDLNVGISYDIKRWVLHYTLNPDTGIYTYYWDNQPNPPSLDVSWRLNLPVLQTTVRDFGGHGAFTDSGCWTDFVVTMPDGGKHLFRNKAACWGFSPSLGTLSFPSFNRPLWDAQDASLMRLDTTNPADIVLYLKNGTRMHFFSNLSIQGGLDTKIVDKIEDTDGNQITVMSTNPNINGAPPYVNSITDTLNRVVNFNYPTTPPGAPYYPSSISYKDSSGSTQSITFGYGTFACNPTFSLPAGSIPSHNCNSLSSVTLPNNLHYSFQYNSTLGELSQIDYPTGGYTRYDYATNTNLQYWDDSSADIAEDFREISARRVCRSSTGSCATEDITTYTATIDGSKASNGYMNVLDASGNLSRFQFSQGITIFNSSARELMHWQYSGPNAVPGALLRTTQTDYNQLDQGGNPKDDSLPIRVTTTLNDTNQVTKWNPTTTAM